MRIEEIRSYRLTATPLSIPIGLRSILLDTKEPVALAVTEGGESLTVNGLFQPPFSCETLFLSAKDPTTATILFLNEV